MLEVEVEEVVMELILIRVAEDAEVVTELHTIVGLVVLLAIEAEVVVEVGAILEVVVVVNEYLYLDTLQIADII